MFIPILPSALLDFLSAPTPFIMGIHESYKDYLASDLVSDDWFTCYVHLASEYCYFYMGRFMSWENKENRVFWLTIYADKKGLSCLPSVACLVPVRIIGGQLSIELFGQQFHVTTATFFWFLSQCLCLAVQVWLVSEWNDVSEFWLLCIVLADWCNSCRYWWRTCQHSRLYQSSLLVRTISE